MQYFMLGHITYPLIGTLCKSTLLFVIYVIIVTNVMDVTDPLPPPNVA